MDEDSGEAPALQVPLVVREGDLHLCIRPITPADRDELVRGLESLSSETMYRRFFVSAFSPSERELEYLTDVDGHGHVALGALDCSQYLPRGTGVARYIRLPEDPTVAEAAIVVVDAYQGRGIGTLLLAALSMRAAAGGVEWLRGYVLVENTRVIETLRALGATGSSAQSGILQLDVPVYAHSGAVPSHPDLERAHWAWRTLEAAETGACDERADRS